jgi:plastocyanin
MRRILILAAVPALSAAIAIPALAATKSVEVDDNYFVHEHGTPTVTVKKNDTVRWRWEGKNPHNVTVTSGPVKFHSSTKKSGTFTKKFTRKGTYRIVCTIHADSGMKMTLKVK